MHVFPFSVLSPLDLYFESFNPKLKFFCFISALPEDEWFVETAKSAINKLLLGTEGSEVSEIDEDNIILHDHIVLDSDDSVSSLSSVESTDSFASASMGELDSPRHFDDSEG